MSSFLKRVLTAAVLIPAVLALVFWAPGWLFLLGLAPVLLLALWEYLELASRFGASSTRLPVYLSGLLMLAAGLYWPDQMLAIVAGTTLLSATLELFRRPALSELLPAVGASILGVLYVALPLALAVSLRDGQRGTWVITYVLLLVWAGDTAAYLAGRALGRHKLAPAISPGKTVEGTVASALVTVGIGFWLARTWFPFIAVVHAVALPLCINIFAQAGDLVESGLKRGAGVKDSSNFLPGHGGLLDRIDSLLFAFPAVWYYWHWIA